MLQKKYVQLCTAFFLLCGFPVALCAAKVGLLITATGKYTRFVNRLITSARKHFCLGHEVTYYVFTDGKIRGGRDVVRIEQAKLGWPYDTMMRFEFYANNWDKLQREEYLYACDADMLFVNRVGEEIFGNFVATYHPGFIDKRGTYENDSRSLAYVSEYEGTAYFAGGFYGGRREEVLNLCRKLSQNIRQDLQRGIIAVWHDESHLNRHCIDHPPTVCLSPSYCCPKNQSLPYQKRLMALDKNHDEVRS